MARYVLEVMYDGVQFHGSQVQGETPTVQLALNTALSTLLRQPVLTYGASRTDEGVHARRNYYHFDAPDPLHPAFLYKCNAVLPHGVAVKRLLQATNPELNVRFDAIWRQYRYRIYRVKDPFLVNRAMFYPFPLDMDKLKQTAAVLMEYTHFESFSKRNAQSKTFICTIQQSEWQEVDGELHYVVRANRFLRGMVRGLVATQLQIARTDATIDDFRAIILANDCTKALFNVPGHGLYLEKIAYPEGAMVELQLPTMLQKK